MYRQSVADGTPIPWWQVGLAVAAGVLLLGDHDASKPLASKAMALHSRSDGVYHAGYRGWTIIVRPSGRPGGWWEWAAVPQANAYRAFANDELDRYTSRYTGHGTADTRAEGIRQAKRSVDQES